MDVEVVRRNLLDCGWSAEGADFLLEKRHTYEGAKILERFGGTKVKRLHRYKKDIPDSLRWYVWERDNFTCQQCGSRHYLTIDHIKPESLGGTLEPENLQTLCGSCNSRKGHQG